MNSKVALLLLLFFISCGNEDELTDSSAPEISVATDNKIYLPGEMATISVDVEAPGGLKEVKIGPTSITTFKDEISVNDIISEYRIPEDALPGDHKVIVVAIDKQNPPKTDTAEAILNIGEKPCPNYDESESLDGGWTMVFEEEFSSDLSKWDVWTGGAYNNELQHYQGDNLEINDGVLKISAKKETVNGSTDPNNATTKEFNYTSGRIESKESFSANTGSPKVRMVAKIMWPNGHGLWPAFWSYGDPWPTQGEIDILEARGNEPTEYHTNYFYGTQEGVNLVQNATGTINADTDLTACYHVYELIWEENKLTSYLDGKLVEVKTAGGYIDELFGKTQNIVLNLAVGGDYFNNLDPASIDEGVMFIDYVRVYTAE
ncbi:glycoside hydrolase family 16 protein [Salinimicrobium terrae]|uniref:glycoside hydrolase family 16 protein n=1 Tax=Salinimicrobium terrae TaxID=470866 RepID=UPI00041664B4|nr:glycoside hydrolase family 16 protein [Salinimicrobium terrae]